MLVEAYVYVCRTLNQYLVMGVRKNTSDTLYMFKPEHQDPSFHMEVMIDARKLGMVNYRNIKITGKLLAKYYDTTTGLFAFQGDFLTVDKEVSVNMSNGGM